MLIIKKSNFRTIPGLIYISTLLFSSVYVQAKINQDMIDTFYLELYNYRFLSADSTLNQIEIVEKDTGITNLLQITCQWWLIISGENDPAGIDPLLDKIDQSISCITEKNSSDELSRNELLQLIAMYSYKSRVHNLHHNRLSSYAAFYASMDYFEQLLPCEKISCDMYNFIAGMYYSLGGYLKKEHPSLFFLGFDNRYADQEKGYALLQQCTHSENRQVQTESIYFFMKLYMDVDEDPDAALKYSEMLIEKYPDNLVFRYNQLQILKDQELIDRMGKEYIELEKRASQNTQLSEKQKMHFVDEYCRLNQ
jgi:hypothetical protein